MDRLTSLTAFVRVVDTGGFSAAGRRLNMSTTMVSNHVQSLEDRLGARLLNRTTRKVSLTEVGKTYYDRCTQILADLEQADDIAGSSQSIPRGTLRIYTGTHIVPFVAPVVAEFLACYPEVKVDLTMGERTVDMIDEGYDVAVRLDAAAGLQPDRPQPRHLAARAVLLAGYLETHRGRSNCRIWRSIIASATCFIRLATSGISPIARACRLRCGYPAIWSPTAATCCGWRRCRAPAFAWRRAFWCTTISKPAG